MAGAVNTCPICKQDVYDMEPCCGLTGRQVAEGDVWAKCSDPNCDYAMAEADPRFEPNEALHARSCHVETTDKLVDFFYLLMRDHVPAGTIEKLVRECDEERGISSIFTNGWLASYAKDLAHRLRSNT